MSLSWGRKILCPGLPHSPKVSRVLNELKQFELHGLFFCCKTTITEMAFKSVPFLTLRVLE